MIVPPSLTTKSADMQPQPVWKKRWSVGAKTPQIGDVGLVARMLVRVDLVEALDRHPVSLGMRPEEAVDDASRACRG